MINKCNINDINRIIELGKLINTNFDKLNNLEEIIKNKEIIGYYIDNKLGSNVASGVATAFIKGANLRGKTKKQIAVLEVDERSANKVYPYLDLLYNNAFGWRLNVSNSELTKRNAF